MEPSVLPAAVVAPYLRRNAGPTELTSEQQYAYITLLSRGGSPAAACAQLHLHLSDVIWMIQHHDDFRAMVERVQQLLSQNVAAALYRSAMEGSVTAQQNYLKAYPLSTVSATEGESDTLPHSELSDEELIRQLREEAKLFLARYPEDDERTQAAPA